MADLHQRTREGLLTAKLNGKQVGHRKGDGFETKKAREAKRVISTHCKAFGGTLDDAECMKLTGLARNTYYKYKRQIREEQEAAKVCGRWSNACQGKNMTDPEKEPSCSF